MLRVVKKFKRLPDYFFIENVPGFKKSQCSSYRRLKSFLKKNHYSVGEDVIDAAIYGVPQRRKRFILIAKKEVSEEQVKKLMFPPITHGPGKIDFVTVEQAFNKPSPLPPIKSGGNSPKFFNHHVPKLSPENSKRIKGTPKNGGSHRDIPQQDRVPCRLRHPTKHSDTYGRMWWKKVSPTLTCKCVSISNGRFVHPTQNRAISIREAARLQTFPDNYKFYGTGITSEARQVGNAVPVKLAEVFGKYFVELDQKQKE